MEPEISTKTGLEIPTVVIQVDPEFSTGKINWSEYNFPPFIHIVHFSLSELEGSIKSFVFCLYADYLIIIGILIMNRMIQLI